MDWFLKLTHKGRDLYPKLREVFEKPEYYKNEKVRGEVFRQFGYFMAQDVTAEADSAGHTDNRPLVTLLPTMLSLCQRMQQAHGYVQRLRVGAAGGLSTPSALAAAFAMGAAYVVTGSVNQACIESGSCSTVRRLLSQAEQADTAMAPAADMGAFNEWVKGTSLEKPENRRVEYVAKSLLYGAAFELRALALRNQGVPWPNELLNCPPLEPEDLKKALQYNE